MSFFKKKCCNFLTINTSIMVPIAFRLPWGSLNKINNGVNFEKNGLFFFITFQFWVIDALIMAPIAF